MLNYVDLIKNTVIGIWGVTEIIAREISKIRKCYIYTDYEILIKTSNSLQFLQI